jgi:hypothetical protein
MIEPVKLAFFRSAKTVIRTLKEMGTDAFIVSHPKCGRTWLTVMLVKAINEAYGLADDRSLNLYRATRRAGLQRTQLTHDRTSAALALPYSRLPTDKSSFRSKKVLFVTREPKDTLVSFYYHVSRRMRPVYRYHGDLSQFIRDERYGIRKLLTFQGIWHANRHVPKDFLVVTYEDLHEDPHGALRRALAFLGAERVPDRVIASAVEFARFDNMRAMERQQTYTSRALRGRGSSDPDTFKVRRGERGGYRSELSADDVRYIDDMAEALGNPFARTDADSRAGQGTGAATEARP